VAVVAARIGDVLSRRHVFPMRALRSALRRRLESLRYLRAIWLRGARWIMSASLLTVAGGVIAFVVSLGTKRFS